jgi:6-phosphogluconolactonase
MIETFPDADALAEAATQAVQAALARTLATGARASLVATGGRSPGPVYDRLSALDDLDWARVDVTLSDERFVPASDPASNEGLVRGRLLTGPARAARFIPLMRRGAADAAESARLAEAEVAALSPFDMTLLGMGPDGHVASLIPGAQGLDAAMSSQAFCHGFNAPIGDPPRPRITLTLQALMQSKAVLVLIAGAEKRAVALAAAEGADLPVRALLTQTRLPVRVLWTP